MNLTFVSLDENRGATPPLGIASLATYLQKYSDKRATIIDANFDDVFEAVIKSRPDVIGISAQTIHYNRAIALAKRLKEEIKVPIVIGGVHISTLPYSLEKCFDIAVLGEGEVTLLELVKLYKKKKGFFIKDLKRINGLAFYEKNNLIITKPRPLVQKLDNIPFPDYSFLNKNYLNKKLHHDSQFSAMVDILTSRGCPYRCTFCSTSLFWKQIRFYSAEAVVAEIEKFAKQGVFSFQIWDDLFVTNFSRLKRMVELLKAKGLLGKVEFYAQCRANVFDDNVGRVLKELNVRSLDFGFESGSEKVLNFLKCGSVRVEDNYRAVKLCNKYKFLLYGSLIFGSPFETLEDMKKTIKFIEFAKQHKYTMDLAAFIMTPFPGTRIWEIAKERGKVKDKGMDWDLLSHENISNPLLLDDSIKLEDFHKVFLEARTKLKYFKWKKLKNDIFSGHILMLMKHAITEPKLVYNLLFKKYAASVQQI